MIDTFVIPELELNLSQQLQDALDAKTKPLGSLGRLETLAVQIGLIQQSFKPQIAKPTLLVFAADHGIAASGVSPYPQSVTASMLKNFAAGGAAINVIARQLGWRLQLINAGTSTPLDLPGVLDRRMGPGTKSMLEGPALSSNELEQAVEAGATLVRTLAGSGCNTIAFGDMGIGNSSSAALLIHYLCKIPLATAISRGAGCSDKQLQTKHEILAQVCLRHGSITEPWEAMRAVGGFELAMIAGAALAAAELKMLILVDGLIVSSAILVALKAYPNLHPYLVFAHESAAQGHTALLDHIGGEALLNLGLRLGEGSGAALALPLVQSAAAILSEMASFASADVAEMVPE